MLNHITRLLRFGDDSADEHEVYANIVSGVDFRGAKLWILVIAVFVASLGLNTNSAAVIIGAMLISPLMGPIIGMGLGAGTYDFELLGRSWRNYIVATIFSILTATFYFLITPVADAQSELLARTSPTIYDVLIALGGGLAGIIALGSRSQRTGNVIPGVAIATALMPPLCTVGFGIATANWSYAVGALYLFLINTIFIAFATLVGVVFIMKFKKKTFIDPQKAKRVKRIIYCIVVVTMVPALFLTVGMVKENYFKKQVAAFVGHELHFPSTQVISYTSDYATRSFSAVLLGKEVDTFAINTARQRLSLYNLGGVEMTIFQGENGTPMTDRQNLYTNADDAMARLQVNLAQKEEKLKLYESDAKNAPQIYRELKTVCPYAESIIMSRATLVNDSASYNGRVVIVSHVKPLPVSEREKTTKWLKARLDDDSVMVIYNTN